MENTKLILKCIKFYIDNITENGKTCIKCPTIDQMREIIQIDDIIKSLETKINKTN